MKKKILIVDDELDMLQLLQRTLEKDLAAQVLVASSAQMALEHLARHRLDLVLADIKMPGMDGLALLAEIKQRSPDLTVVLMTAYGHIEMAVAAMKHGAYDFITKPFDHDALLLRLEKALERSALVDENRRLQRECGSRREFKDLVGSSAAMRKVYETIQTVAQSDLTVLITGESGTGKDLTARAVHALSSRNKRSFVAVNCATVPENILESELFGYRKGAFTHATQNKIGLFQEAHTGSIFLDEIGDISPVIQSKLLRVLQEKEIKPLGDTKTIHVDTRIIASTNQDLQAKIIAGEFREDFFYRLNVLPIVLPPLRDRSEDIPLIANHLLKKHCAEMGKPVKRISNGLMARLIERPWVGNVRELENVLLRGIMFSQGSDIRPQDAEMDTGTVRPATAQVPFKSMPYKQAKAQALGRFHAGYIDHWLRANNGNVTRTARSCGLERQALQQIMRRYDIKPATYRK